MQFVKRYTQKKQGVKKQKRAKIASNDRHTKKRKKDKKVLIQMITAAERRARIDKLKRDREIKEEQRKKEREERKR